MSGLARGRSRGVAARGRDDAAALAGCRVLRTYEGVEPTPDIIDVIRAGRASGVTLFRAKNIGSPADVREACAALQAARPPGDPPLVIGLDQEGGQLQAVGHGATAWPGNLALGAAGTADAAQAEQLARAAGAAIGAEAAAMGATLAFAPVCDVVQPIAATPMGTRSFGSDPALVGRLAAAFTDGLQEAGIAAVLKHFPGHGAASGDSHLAMPVVDADADTLRGRELAPFRAGIAAGALAVLPGHVAVPALTGGRPVAATVSPAILEDLLRGELGFDGLTISDALDMGGAGPAGSIGETAVAAAAAGMDLLLLVHPHDVEDAVVEALVGALRSGRLDLARAEAARERILRIRARLADGPTGRRAPRGREQPSLDVVGCVAHRALARRIAVASITLVRDPRGLLPLLPGALRKVALFAPVPVDLTPAETSSHVHLGLGQALRERGSAVEELVVPLDPTPAEVAALVHAAGSADVALAATFDAITHPGQVELVRALAARRPTAAVALRSPYDAALFAQDVTTLCTYGIQEPQMDALADGLVGRIPFAGRLPVSLEKLA